VTTFAETPDIILCNGHVAGSGGQGLPAQALAIARGRILAVGENGAVGRLAGKGT